MPPAFAPREHRPQHTDVNENTFAHPMQVHEDDQEVLPEEQQQTAQQSITSNAPGDAGAGENPSSNSDFSMVGNDDSEFVPMVGNKTEFIPMVPNTDPSDFIPMTGNTAPSDFIKMTPNPTEIIQMVPNPASDTLGRTEVSEGGTSDAEQEAEQQEEVSTGFSGGKGMESGGTDADGEAPDGTANNAGETNHSFVKVGGQQKAKSKTTPPESQNGTVGPPAVTTATGTPTGGGMEGAATEGSGPATQAPVQLPTGNSKEYTESLTSQPPTAFIQGMKQAGSDASQAFGSEQSTLKSSLPTIKQPTGLPMKPETARKANLEKPKAIANDLQKNPASVPNLTPKGKKEGHQVPEESQQPQSTFLGRVMNFFGFGEDKKGEISQGIKNLPTSDNVDTNVGTPPNVDLSGQADPNQNQSNLQGADASVTKDQQTNAAESKLYRGEQDIYPSVERETLSPSNELTPPPSTASLREEIPPVSQELYDNFNTAAQADLDKQLAPEKDKQAAAYEKMQADQEKEQANTDARINEATEQVKAQQKEAQQKAQSDVATHRASWQAENEAVKKEFESKSETAKQKVDTEIDTKVKEADAQVATEYGKAQQEADTKVAETETEAKRRKQAAQAQTKEKSWWDRAVDAVSNFFDKLKEGLNKLFDGLRKLVKVIIEKAKKLANKLIDLARDAIVSAIKAFGEVLKGFVNIALAAFPKLRNKFNNLIDKAVSYAVDKVNQLAEGLKKAVSALLDALGAVLDAILAVYQAFYNLLLDTLKFIAVGMLKVLRFLANLVTGAALSPLAFPSELAKESLGGDPSQPLPNFEVPLGQEKAWAQAMGLEEGQEQVAANTAIQATETVPDALQEVLTKQELNDSDVVLEPNPAVELDPAILQQLASLPEGQPLELGGAGSNGVSTEDFQATAAHAAGINLSSLVGGTTGDSSTTTSPEGTGNTVVPSNDGAGGGSGPDWRKMSDQQKLDHYLAEMLTPAKEAGTQQPSPGTSKKPAPNQELTPEALITKTGRLGTGQRLAFMGQQMMTGIQVMWQKYKGWIIAGLVTALIAAGAIAFFTGGAGLALAVDILVKAMIVIFGAIAVYKAVGSIWDYVKHAWNGDPQKASQSLAKAFAIIIVEFFIDKILLGMGKVFKRILAATKATMRTTKAGRRVLVGLTNAKRLAGRGVRATKGVVRKGIARIKNTKLVVAMRNKVGKGAKSLGELRERILERFGFEKFKIERMGNHVQMWGYFNPWVLLSEGKVDYKEKLDNVEGTTARLGDHVKIKGVDGIIIGEKNLGSKFRKKGSTYVERYRSNKEAAKSKFDDLYSEKDALVRKREIKGETGRTHEENIGLFGQEVADTIKSRDKIRTSIGSKPKTAHGFDDWNAHHILPVEAIENSKLLQEAIRQGFEFNGKANGKWLRRYSSEVRTNPKTGKIIASPSGTHASHDTYNQAVIKFLNNIENLPNYNPAKAKQFAEEASKAIRKKIDDMLLQNQKHLKEQLAIGRKMEDIMKDLQIIRINQLRI